MDRTQERRFRDVLTKVSRGVKGASAEEMRKLGVHVGQNFLLEALWADDGLTLGELARRIGVEVPTVTRMTKRMEAAGLVSRSIDARDRRVVRVSLTERGEELRGILPKVLDEIAARTLGDLTTDERDQLIALLGRAATNLAGPAGPAAPAC